MNAAHEQGRSCHARPAIVACAPRDPGGDVRAREWATIGASGPFESLSGSISMAKRRYFGTDGVRGEVGTPPITADFVLRLGWAAGRVLARRAGGADKAGPVLIGKDTRISGYMFESVLEAGLTSAGIDVALLGPMPTPAIAYLTRTFQGLCGHRHQRLAQRLPRQRHQVLRRRWRQAARRRRGRDRGRDGPRHGDRDARASSAAPGASSTPRGATSSSARAPCPRVSTCAA